jgi:hypothetical protein
MNCDVMGVMTKCYINKSPVWLVLVGSSVNPLQNRETQHVNIALQSMYRFFEQPNIKGNHARIEW